MLPWITLAFLYAALYARLTRAGMLETMGEDYIRTARAKGLPERTVIVKHGLRAALTPIVTIFGMDIGLLIGGAVLTEYMFSLHGLGLFTIEAIQDQDFPEIMGVVMLTAFFVVIANMIVDILYAVIDPRVRVRAERGRGPPCCEVRDLRVHFPTEDGLVKAVDGLSFRLERGQTLGIVGESGSGKSVTSLAIWACTTALARRSPARSTSTARSWSAPSPAGCAELRGSKMAMIFQDPLSSLHPFYTVGAADRRGVPGAQQGQQEGAAAARRRACSTGSASRSPQRGSTTTRTSSPAGCASAR